MRAYEAGWLLLLAKRALKDCSFVPDPIRNEQLSAEIQEAMALARNIVQGDYQERENEAYDVGWQSAAAQLKQLDWAGAELIEKVISPAPFSREELSTIEPGRWLWLESLAPEPACLEKSTYVMVVSNTDGGQSFRCGYPGLEYQLDYDEYGHQWLAYPRQPLPKPG